MKLELVIVVASIARENVAFTFDVTTTLVPVGLVVVTVGADAAAVVKLHETGAESAVPSATLTVASRAAV